MVVTRLITPLIFLSRPEWALRVTRPKCPYCGVSCVLNDNYEWVCPSCGLVVDDSRVVQDDYHNLVFMDDYRGRVEPELKRRLRRQWREASSIEHKTRGGTNYVVELVRSKLKQLYPEYREYLDNVDVHSLKELFRHFLLATNLPYDEARRVFLDICRKAGIRLPRLRPVKVLTPSAVRRRLKVRGSKIAESLINIGDAKVRDLVEALMKIPEFQPININALIVAVEKWVNGKSSVREYSKRAFRRYLKLLEKYSKINAYILAERYGLKLNHIALLKRISIHGVRESIRRGRRILNAIDDTLGSALVVANALYPEVGETHLKVISHYKRYSDYVRACKAFNLEPLDKKEWRKIKADLELLRDNPLSYIQCLIPIWEVEYKLNLITPYKNLTST
ncbi:MAG: TFIIB-type zinc ribbon-containing protein [Thermoprotei archaeon]|nr:TFIIB-type zinc ribbon-containing protein [Thermoprotei archaeon]